MADYTEKDVIWVEEARFKYNHSRDWFMRRINDGRLKAVYLPGSIRVYLVRNELEKYMKEHDKEQD
jgi:hypothetical protein